MSSPQINNLIIAGCILAYTSVLLMGIDSTLLGKNSSKSAMNFICAVRIVYFELVTFRFNFKFLKRLVYGRYQSVLQHLLELYLVRHGVYIQYLRM